LLKNTRSNEKSVIVSALCVQLVVCFTSHKDTRSTSKLAKTEQGNIIGQKIVMRMVPVCVSSPLRRFFVKKSTTEIEAQTNDAVKNYIVFAKLNIKDMF
jgi:hypothetical protein